MAFTLLEYEQMALALRTAVDFGIPALGLLENNENGTVTGTVDGAELAFSRESVFTGWMTIESVFLLFTLGALFSRKFCKEKEKNSDDAQQVQKKESWWDRVSPSNRRIFWVRFITLIASALTVSLLASDLDGSTNRSSAAVILIILTNFLMVEYTQELKEEEEEQQERVEFNMFNARARIPEGYVVNSDHTYSAEEVRLGVQALVKKANHASLAGDGEHYKLSHDPGKTVYITPPIVDISNGNPRFEHRLGKGSIDVFLRQDSNNLTQSVLGELRQNLPNLVAHEHRILSLVQGLDQSTAITQQQWATIEIKIVQTSDGANLANNSYDISIFKHSPHEGGSSVALTNDQYFPLARAISNVLLDVSTTLQAAQLHFKDRAGGDINIPGFNSATDMAANTTPVSAHKHARLTAENTESSAIAALDDVDRLVSGAAVRDRELAPSDTDRLRTKNRALILLHNPQSETENFNSRSITLDAIFSRMELTV